MIKQYINGSLVGTSSPSMTNADFGILAAVLAGRSENWELHASGGTTLNGVAVLNFKKFAFGKETINGRKSSAVTVPHVKAGVGIMEIRPLVVGKFYVDASLTEKAEYCNGIGDSSKG